jgi:predicted nuclease of predicted toxin-antitoxin system
MPRFVIDEDMPRSTGMILREHGYTIEDIRDHGLRGAGDDEVFKFAQREKAVLVTSDMGFGNIIRFPPSSHFGIIVTHFPNTMSVEELNRQFVEAITGLQETDFRGNLIILEPGKIRIKRG